MERTDAELMRQWQAGESGAFEALVHRWQGRVLRLLARLAGTQAAPDLGQEVFLRLFQARQRYREQGTFATWLYRIVLNVARDAGRRQRPAVSLDIPRLLDTVEPTDALCQREAVQAVARALNDLPEPLREVLVLRHYEELNFEEIARLTKTPASTLKSRFATALNRLRHRLKKEGWGPEETAP